MDIKIEYTSINTFTSSTSKCIRTYYRTTIEDALAMLREDEPEGLKIQKIEVINQ